MKIPDWIKPANWTPETKAAARETVKVAVIFAVTLLHAGRARQGSRESAARRLSGR